MDQNKYYVAINDKWEEVTVVRKYFYGFGSYYDELQFEDNTELKQRAIKKFEELSIPLFRDKKLQELGI